MAPFYGTRRHSAAARLQQLGCHLRQDLPPQRQSGAPQLDDIATSGTAAAAAGRGRPRARDLGVVLEGETGPLNAITDVAGVTVGHTTLCHGDGAGAVRTGVTAVLPRGAADSACFAGIFSLNGAGEMTGSHWVEESGILYGPVTITNTHSVGVVRDAVIRWQKRFHADQSWFGLPVVAETYDGFLSDIDGHHVTGEDATAALDGARGGAVEEGCVGGGTGEPNLCCAPAAAESCTRRGWGGAWPHGSASMCMGRSTTASVVLHRRRHADSALQGGYRDCESSGPRRHRHRDDDRLFLFCSGGINAGAGGCLSRATDVTVMLHDAGRSPDATPWGCSSNPTTAGAGSCA
jgi:hypothetical protein